MSPHRNDQTKMSRDRNEIYSGKEPLFWAHNKPARMPSPRFNAPALFRGSTERRHTPIDELPF